MVQHLDPEGYRTPRPEISISDEPCTVFMADNLYHQPETVIQQATPAVSFEQIETGLLWGNKDFKQHIPEAAPQEIRFYAGLMTHRFWSNAPGEGRNNSTHKVLEAARTAGILEVQPDAEKLYNSSRQNYWVHVVHDRTGKINRVEVINPTTYPDTDFEEGQLLTGETEPIKHLLTAYYDSEHLPTPNTQADQLLV